MTESETATTPLSAPEPGDKPSRPTGRWWRGLSGSVAAGLVVLALGVACTGALSLFTEINGPGAFSLFGHLIAAGLALLAQRYADRHRGAPAAAAALSVLVITVAAVWLFWWS
ncbi:hypothetical protein SAMN05421504_114121 [Amycolatopsis xylanica]|uniref:Uncharacterized protein n=1 Tax=Amycolatopsis xylanica TaxID=589385 RepID=A0A1H3SLT0_9PSEU|nr:hypothetical protein [Amycolatopsis xylanica]SDZ38956.1 hypothetical protein SAMN05421504_114121 [Amycolatopsis xylanica]